MSEIRGNSAPRTQRVTTPKKTAPAPKQQKTSVPKSEQLGKVAASFSDDKAMGLSELPTLKKKPQPKISNEELAKDKRSSFLGHSDRFHNLKDAENQLEQVRQGNHERLNSETEAIQQEYDDSMRRLREGRTQARSDIERLRNETRERLRTVRRQVRTNYKEERREISRLSSRYRAESRTLKDSDAEAARLAFKGTYQEGRMADETLSDEARDRAERQRDKWNAKLKDQFGFELPTSAEMEKYRKNGPPTGDSLKDKVHRMAFTRTSMREMRAAIPKGEEAQQAHLKATEASTERKLKDLDERSQRVEPTFQRYSREYEATRDKKTSEARDRVVSELNQRVRENSSYKISELPQALQDSVAAQGLPADATARLDGDTLVYRREDGQQVKIQAHRQGGTRVTTASEHVSSESIIGTDGAERSETTTTSRFSDRRVVDTYKNDAKGNEVHTQSVTSDGYQENTRRELRDGREVSSVKTRRSQGRETYRRESETEYLESGKSRTETTTQYPEDQQRVVKNETKNADGQTTGRTRVETQRLENGVRTNTQILLDPATGRTRETESSTIHNDGSRTETTTTYEGNADSDGYIESKKQTSRVRETITDPHYASDDEKDLPGLGGWVPWDNPQDLMNDMESRGGLVKKQNVTREVTGPDGESRTEHVTRFFNNDNEIQLTKGPDGKNVWTHRVRVEGTDKWDSQVFFQGSDEDTITTKHTREGRYDVQTTTAKMEDHPGMESNKVPRSSTAVVRSAEGVNMGEIDRVASEIGFSRDELSNMDALQTFRDKFGSAENLKIEIRTNDDQFYSSSKNKKGATVIVTGPDGSKLVLSRDQLENTGGIRAEWKDEDGRLQTQESLTNGDEIYERPAGPANQDNSRAQDVRNAFKHSEFLLKRANAGFRVTGRISGSTVSRAAPGLDAISGGLATISAAHDFINGDYARGIANVGGAASDFGMMIRAAQELKTDKLAAGFGTGAAGVIKRVGVAGAAIGVFSGVGKVIDGDRVGGGLDIGASVFAGAAIYGVPGIGWVAGGLALGSAIWDYRGDTVIANPELTRD